MNVVREPEAEVIRRREVKVLAPQAPGHDHAVWKEAHGSIVTTVDGRELVDFSSGVLVANIGHSHPHVAAAIAAQAGRLLTSYDAPHPMRAELAERILALAGPPMDAIAFLTTGAEAIDAALRVARAATGRFSILSFSDAFHGKSLSAVSVSGRPAGRKGIGPLMPGTLLSPYPYPYRPPVGLSPDRLTDGCIALADDLIAANLTEEPAAIVVEPYLGSGGGVVPPEDFLPKLRDLADRHGALLIIDEVQSGFGRGGSMFAFQRLGVRPDLVAIAKGIASGVPMSGLMGRRELLDAAPAGSLWSTYGGNALSCAASLATLDVLTTPGLIERVRPLGDRMADEIRSWGIVGVGDVRNFGLSFGIELVSDERAKTPDPTRALATLIAADRHGVITLPPSGAAGNALRLAPPLVITDSEVERGLTALRNALEETAP
jgi:4-aminobutyrate aminotransferase-like enzyme